MVEGGGSEAHEVQASKKTGLAGLLCSEAGIFTAVLVFAAALRVLYWLRLQIMFEDGPKFLYMAQHMEAGRWAEALSHDYHPLYSYLTLLVHKALSDWELAAATVSILGGLLSVAGLYWLVRQAFGRTEAWVAALFLAVNPYAVAFSSDVQSDGLYMGFFVTGAALLWAAWEKQSLKFAGLTGVCAGLAYLVRPEGLGIVLVAGLLLGFEVLRRQWPWKKALGWGLVVGCSAFLVIAPYLVQQYGQAGSWSLTKKKSVVELSIAGGIGSETPKASERKERKDRPEWRKEREKKQYSKLGAVVQVFREFASAPRYEIVVLLLLGLYSVRGSIGARGRFFGGFFGLYFFVLYGLLLLADYLSRRHALPVATVVFFGYAAVGASVFGQIVARILGPVVPKLRNPSAQMALVLGVVLVLSLGLVKQFRKAPREGKATEKLAAIWLQEEHHPSSPVATMKSRVAYYAGAPHVSLRHAVKRGKLETLPSKGVRYVIVNVRDLEKYPELLEMLETGYDEVHTESDAGYHAKVFRLRKVPDASLKEPPRNGG